MTDPVTTDQLRTAILELEAKLTEAIHQTEGRILARFDAAIASTNGRIVAIEVAEATCRSAVVARLDQVEHKGSRNGGVWTDARLWAGIGIGIGSLIVVVAQFVLQHLR